MVGADGPRNDDDDEMVGPPRPADDGEQDEEDDHIGPEPPKAKKRKVWYRSLIA
jgi:hypothetical protein